MSLRIHDNLLIGYPGGSGRGGASYNWPSPVTAKGTGAVQMIQLPESGLSDANLIVFQDGKLRSNGFFVSNDKLVITAPQNSDIWIAKYGAGARGEKGDTGDRGDIGQIGPKGDKGDDGSPFVIMGTLPSVQDLPNTGSPTEAYIIDGLLYGWDGTSWVSQGSVFNDKAGEDPYDLDGGSF